MSFSPVMLVSGADAYRRRKRVRRLLQGVQEQGWRVSEVSGEDHSRLGRLLTGSSIFRAKTLIVIHHPDKVNVDLVVQQHEKPVGDMVLLLHQDGEKKGSFSKLVKRLPDKIHQHFPRVSSWKQAGDAASLCQVELRERGKVLSQGLAEQVVRLVGADDLGFLSYEMLKLSMLLDFLGETEVKSSHVVSTIAIMEEASVFPILEALGAVSMKKLQAALGLVERTTPGDPTIKVVRMIAPTLGKWIAAASLDEKKVPPDEAAVLIGHNQWYHKNKILPPAKRWGSRRLIALLGGLAQAERSVFTGKIAPWVILESCLVRACSQLQKRKASDLVAG